MNPVVNATIAIESLRGRIWLRSRTGNERTSATVDPTSSRDTTLPAFMASKRIASPISSSRIRRVREEM